MPESSRSRPLRLPPLLRNRLHHLQQILLPLTILLIAMWSVSLYALNLHHDVIYELALIPRSVQGLNGILTMPLVHGSLQHLLVNTPLLAVFSGVVLWRGTRYYCAVTLLILLMAGSALWLIGRTGAHIGASALIFGYFGLLSARGFFEKRFLSIAVSMAVVGVYSSLLWGIVPDDEGVSWEGHLTGLLAGIMTARLLSSKLDRI